MSDRYIYAIELFRQPYEGQHIVWGNYESISIKKIKSLSDIITFPVQDNNPQDSDNTFASNTFFLYTIPSINSSVKYCNQSHCFVADKQYDFIAITLFTLTSSAINEMRTTQKTFTDNVCINIHKKLTSNNTNNTKYNLFGALGTNHIATVCLSDNVEECLKFVETVQNLYSDNQNPYFDNSFTLVSFAHDNVNCPQTFSSNNHNFANIQITYRCYEKFDDVIAYLNGSNNNCGLDILNRNGKVRKNVKIFSTLGEYDIVIQIPIDYLNMKAYQHGGVLHPKTDGYDKYILQCNTRFSNRKDSLSIKNKNCNIENTKKIKHKSESDDKLDRLYNNMQNSLNSNKISPYLNNIVSLLYSDFKKITSFNIYGWTDDIREQFVAIFKCLNTFIDHCTYTKQFGKEHLEFCLKLIEISELTLNHVEQSGYFRLEPSRIYLSNTGLYDKIFRCCYGIVKAIIVGVYSLGNIDQSNLIPFITINANSTISSEILLDLDIKGYNERILSISVPRDFYSHIDYYIPLFIHEIGHYVCPKNRLLRNKRMFNILLAHFLLDIFKNSKVKVSDVIHWIENELCSGNDLIKFTNDLYKKSWKNFFYDIKKEFKLALYANETYYSEINIFINKFTVKFMNHTDSYINTNSLQHRKGILDNIDSIADGIREAIADRFMIQWSGMDGITYIAYIFSIRARQFIQKDATLLSYIRIGCVLDIFLNNTEEIISRKQFETIFSKTKIFECIRNICNHIDINFTQDNIDEFYEEIFENYTSYQSGYDVYRKYFKCIIESEDYVVNEIPQNDIVLHSMKQIFYFLNNDYYINFNDNNRYIKTINDFYIQPTIKELNEYYDILCDNLKSNKVNNTSNLESSLWDDIRNQNSNTMHPYTNYRYNTEIPVNSVESFNAALIDTKKILTDSENDPLWFRGHSTLSWKMQPNLLRQAKTNYRLNFKIAYENFIAEAYESLDILVGSLSVADWIAYMQHYYIPTNFLDWSEQPMTALYFALENYFDDYCKYYKNNPVFDECKNETKNKVLKDSAAIYVLNPKRMNTLFFNSSEGIIPNLSLKYNEDKYKEYLIPDITNKISNITTKELIQSSTENSKNFLPIAILTSQSNSRIRAQKGHFTAFNPNIKLNDNNDITLEYIQDLFYQKALDEGKIKEFKPFLQRIIIPYYLKERMSEWCKEMNVSLSKIYPELDNIGKDITKKTFM